MPWTVFDKSGFCEKLEKKIRISAWNLSSNELNIAEKLSLWKPQNEHWTFVPYSYIQKQMITCVNLPLQQQDK